MIVLKAHDIFKLEKQHTWRLVVADSEVGSHIGAGVGESRLGAVNGSTTDGLGVDPDDLSEVAIALECRSKVVGSRLAVRSAEQGHFIVVVELGDDSSDVVGRSTGGNVLAISTSIDVP